MFSDRPGDNDTCPDSGRHQGEAACEIISLLNDNGPVSKVIDASDLRSGSTRFRAIETYIDLLSTNEAGQIAAGKHKRTVVAPDADVRAPTLQSAPNEEAMKEGKRSSPQPEDDQGDPDSAGSTVIKVVGVGGGGCNAVQYLVKSSLGCNDIELIAVNTDRQSLKALHGAKKIEIGSDGRGVGGDVEKGRRCAEEREKEIADILQGADLLFLCTSMGGGTGTGASPVIARLASEVGILVISVVYMPFAYEGRRETALDGLEELRKHSHSLIVVPNDNFKNIDVPDIYHGMQASHQVAADAISCIYEVLNTHSDINADFNDIRRICSHRGHALIGCGEARGDSENRAEEAVRKALENPLTDAFPLENARGILLYVHGNCRNSEHEEMQNILSKYTSESIKIAMCIDPDCDNRLRVIVIAAGVNYDAAMDKQVENMVEEQNKPESEPTPKATAYRRSTLLSHSERTRQSMSEPVWVTSTALYKNQKD